MQEFIEITASKKSLAFRKPVHGIGINDAWYMVNPKINGKRVMCPYYKVWMNIITRSYSDKYQAKRPTYRGCSVVKEWLTFSNFRGWMEKKDWQGKQLDKDILIPSNKVYGPDTCIFVSGTINHLLTDSSAARGEYPQGTSLHKRSGKYAAQCNVSGKIKYLGLFTTITEAEYAYLIFKANLIKKTAYEPEVASNPKLQVALLRYADMFSKKSDKLKEV